MTALAESAGKISVSLNLDDVMQGIVAQTSQALNTQAVSLALIDPSDGKLVFSRHDRRGGIQRCE